MKTGTIIKTLLSQRGMTIKQLAEKTHISVNTLYSITKRNTDNIQSANLEKILSALDLSELEFHNEAMLYQAKQIGDRLNRFRDGNFPPGDLRRISLPDESGFGDCRLSEDEETIIGAYWQLSNAGKEEALKRIIELGMIEKYKKKD